MTLYTHAESNIRKTFFFLFLFVVFIILIGYLFGYILDNRGILIFAVILSIVMSFASYFYSDKLILSMTRARLIEEKDNKELYHVVENLCITAGLPMPKIYVINESQPNAFATGRNAKHAVIAVTAGLLEKLDKSELEGVIAHELSHIGNKDMLLAAIVVVLAGIVALLSNWFLRISFLGNRKRDDREGNAGALLLVLGLVSAIIAPIAATMIQLAISRKREFLADADGALLTRYPEGLARALEKIASDPNPLRVANNSNAHLFFASPFRGERGSGFLMKLFMTHPPVKERIRILRGMRV